MQERVMFFDLSKIPVREGDFLFPTKENETPHLEIVVTLTPKDYHTFTPALNQVKLRKIADFEADKLRIATPQEKRTMIRFNLEQLALESMRIEATRTFFTKILGNRIDFDDYYMTSKYKDIEI